MQPNQPPPPPGAFPPPGGYPPPPHGQPYPFAPYGAPQAPPVKQGANVLLILAIVGGVLLLAGGMLAAILIPTILGAIDDAKKTADGDNLKGLMKGYVAGLADMKRSPSHENGWHFWTALYTSADSEFGPSDTFMHALDVEFMISPKDPYDDLAAAQTALAAGTAQADPSAVTYDGTHSVCSYAGPAANVMRQQSMLSGRIIGATGGRDGRPIFSSGANVVYGSIKVEFLEWDEFEYIIGEPVGPSARGAELWTTSPLFVDPDVFPD